MEINKPRTLSGSIVLYQNSPEELRQTIASFLNSPIAEKLYLVDNSPTDSLRHISSDARVEYIFNNANIGFGKAHNIALRRALNDYTYHLVLNPDVTFGQDTLEQLRDFMDKNPDTGLVLPKVLSFESELQYVCKRLPQPMDLILRRFGTGVLQKYIERKQYFYEMRDKDYTRPIEAPSLSGCFMFLRTDALRKVGLFDERYFMYMEDIDLSRRMYVQSRNVYYPEALIYHGHARESYKSARLLKIHMKSAIQYFNKWGWLLDRERARINKKV
jgi:GT2 family glycosyltransferase